MPAWRNSINSTVPAPRQPNDTTSASESLVLQLTMTTRAPGPPTIEEVECRQAIFIGRQHQVIGKHGAQRQATRKTGSGSNGVRMDFFHGGK
jgi:hypothetical protein